MGNVKFSLRLCKNKQVDTKIFRDFRPLRFVEISSYAEDEPPAMMDPSNISCQHAKKLCSIRSSYLHGD